MLSVVPAAALQAYFCPNRGASDRHRLYALYLRNDDSFRAGVKRILDIAPSKALSAFINASFPNAHYRTADLYADGVDDKIDLTDMSIYANGQFDFIICSHALEHIQDDKKAIGELCRVLADGCWGIIMVPINLGLQEDYEDPDITTPEGRWKYFGQDAHVRVYSKPGFREKLGDAGFQVHEYGIDFFGGALCQQHGIHPRSVLYVAARA